MTSSPGPERTRRPRGSLNAEKILVAAQEIVERDGLRQLSMPTLAVHLRSGVASIYWYFRNKDALVDALAQRVMTQIHLQLPPVGDGPWHVELERYVDAFYRLLRELPAYREVAAYGSGFITIEALTPVARRRLDDGINLLVGAGLSRTRSIEVLGACLNYTRGFAVMQQGSQQHVTLSTVEGTDSVQNAEVVHLNSLADDRYHLGLRLLVGGIRAEIEGAGHADSAAVPPVIRG